ncbi:hypothetical protein LMG7974_00519 [Campylobacter majalis]|uniref:TM2 domain-containing protein n=1 Tax=Campylobacter majalis TaxID=2790656 RepID=A0ABM8Q434_9BACT|nr:hypothetical protein [Campylobacter majalis]CAD7287639.1 hypothetical protein LMG7974_00519 [Campylobacter majalis]
MQNFQILREIKKRLFGKHYKALNQENLLNSDNINAKFDSLLKKLYELKRPNYIVIFGLLLGNFGVHRYYNDDKKKALYFLIPSVAVLLLSIFVIPEKIAAGINMWI